MKIASHVDQVLKRNPQQRIGENGLADDLNLSRFQLYRRVKASTGISPKELAGRHRIDQACRLLRESSLDVAEIAQQVGIPDANYFARFFKRRIGASPTAWRKRQTASIAARSTVNRLRVQRAQEVVEDLPVHLL